MILFHNPASLSFLKLCPKRTQIRTSQAELTRLRGDREDDDIPLFPAEKKMIPLVQTNEEHVRDQKMVAGGIIKYSLKDGVPQPQS
ncbi:Oidioi.mRNA.OKI2018_I69.chr1.g1759.t1.cds [Oikopleura dioica]|uniref:Oidioi.mRNA.OKI2018_I69.chr1.g1759.t1.cds n=1 Tax=Oikopleura dioica TaxID=34765 RepID=A0ABN7SY25_OIKDI|nr:Oidioi.mRNA.OKI2018_I69.chr1.g1759.t1.cds [Oikopleura dioica]